MNMSIRLRSILVIILTNLLIIFFSVFAGIFFIGENIRSSQETELMVVSDIADHFISSEIENLRLRVSMISASLEETASSQWQEILVSQKLDHGVFTGIAILDRDEGIIASCGDLQFPMELASESFIAAAYGGEIRFSSTYALESGILSYIAAPLTDEQENSKLLIVSLSGMYFSDLVSTITIWDTGHIFMTDHEGNIIANIRENWVQNRINFMRMAEMDSSFIEVASVLRRVVNQETGTGYFSTDGVPRLCSFRPISSSNEGWSMGIIAPLPESPFRDIDRGLLIVGFVAIILSIIAAGIASIYIKKPFLEIASLKEEAERSSMYKSNFLANMSHEMRTPLNVIVGLTDLRMEDRDLSESVHGDLQKINSAGELLLGIVNDVLDISKIEAGKLELVPENYDTAEMFSDIITLNIARMEGRKIQFLADINEDFPKELYGDELRVKQIFNNLLSNAFKYSKEGLIKLIVAGSPVENNRFMLHATVSDTGIGIREEDIAKLFSEYNQVDTKANRKIEGTGLGLAITKKLVQGMKGKIEVESIYGIGTTFSIWIEQGHVSDKIIGRETAELLRSFHYTNKKLNSASRLVRSDLSHARVLVVDDFQTNLDVASGLLKKYKMKVDCIESGREALDLIRAGVPHYDAIFMDHMMPEMDGMEATSLIRELNTEYAKKIPIIALTANALVTNEQMFFENGFNAFVSKPIDLFRLDSVLKKWIPGKNP